MGTAYERTLRSRDCGCDAGVMASVLALVHHGDEVIVLEPTYDSYVPSIELASGRPVFVPLDADRGYAPDWSAFARDHAKTRSSC